MPLPLIALAALFGSDTDVVKTSLVAPPIEAPITVPVPKSRFESMSPLPTLAPVVLDRLGNQFGVAQQMAAEKKLQARILWVDCTANLERFNSDENCANLVRNIKVSGFNTVVLDVKPISGEVIYPSKICPKLTEWKGRQLPADYDPVSKMVQECKAAGLKIFVSMNAFSEGHRDFRRGPGYATVDRQTVIYDPRISLVSAFNTSFTVNPAFNKMPANGLTLGAFNDKSALPTPQDSFYCVSLSRGGQVLEAASGVILRTINIPKDGCVMVGSGDAANFLRAAFPVGSRAKFDTIPEYAPIQERPEQQIPLMMNPHLPEVQQRAADIVKEFVTKYPVDGFLYDDRLRYGGINADFSDTTQRDFERYIGRRIVWPDDVLKITMNPSLNKGVLPGPYYEAWMTFRAMTMRNYVGRIRQVVKSVRPDACFGVYAGSNYGDYPRFGHNWAAPNFEAGYWFLTPEYAATGTASLLDVMITGCYYPTATISEAMAGGIGPGFSVEAAGQSVNRLVHDQAWVYAGIALDQFKGNPEGLQKVLQAACGSTQGVMVFDLSHDIEPMWPVFRAAFLEPRKAPHEEMGLLNEVRKKRAAMDKAGVKEPPAIIFGGGSGVGM
ncbi:MAG: family 10 glycosylhydrolase [Armatimonadetes bacterium]|nr:family 10 glycosylhydrolase [Armatimonadota bacterium]